MIQHPLIIESDKNGSQVYDVYSRLLKDRIIFLRDEVNDDLANSLIAQLLFLDSVDQEKPISMYINSPGGSVSSGLAIYDIMNYISAPVHTVCIGEASSMGAILLACGEPGNRMALPNARIMIHEIASGMEGKASDVLIQHEEMLVFKDILDALLAKVTKKTKKKIQTDTNRDFFMSAEEAKKYGLIDRVITSKGIK